jgi:hypothetical protein
VADFWIKFVDAPIDQDDCLLENENIYDYSQSRSSPWKKIPPDNRVRSHWFVIAIDRWVVARRAVVHVWSDQELPVYSANAPNLFYVKGLSKDWKVS